MPRLRPPILHLDGTHQRADYDIRPWAASDVALASRRLGLPVGALIAGDGESLIRAALQTLVEPGGRCAVALPSDHSIPDLIVDTGRVYVDVGRRFDLSVDLPSLRFVLRRSDVGLVLLGAPDRVAGVGPSERSLRAIEALGCPLLIDRRGAVDGGCAAPLARRDRLTLFAPLPDRAGRSVTFLAGPPELLDRVRREVPTPRGIPPLAEALATSARRAGVARRARGRLIRLLRAIPRVDVAAGDTAFANVRVRGRGADEIVAALDAQGVVVAAFPGSRDRDCVRILAPLDAAGRGRVVAGLTAVASA